MIFAAGLGTRLRPLTDRMPKALVPIHGKPLLLWQIERLKNAGIDRIIVNVHHKAEQIIRYLKENGNFGCDILVSDETDRLLDTGGGLRKALIQYPSDEPTLALNADILSTDIITLLTTAYKGCDNPLVLLVVSSRTTKRYLAFDDAMRLKGWTNTDTGEIRPAGACLRGAKLLAFSGMQIVSPRIMTWMDRMEEDRFSLIDLYMYIIANGGDVRAYIPTDYQMMDVGKIEQLNEAEQWAEQWLM